MSEDSTNQDGNSSGDTSPAGDEFKPITSQEDFENRLKDRLARERAKFADYKDVKAKASRLDEIEQANLSEVEKAKARIAAAEERATKAESSALRLRIAAKHGIGEEDADLFLTGTDEETLTAQAKRLSDREADRKKNGNRVPREGTSSTSVENEASEFARSLFDG